MTASVCFLGSGDSFGSGGRFQTCILVDLGGRRVLLDCGASSLIAMRSQGVDPSSIDVILLTHMHGDHCAGVPFLLMDGMLGGKRTRPLVVAGPAGTSQHMAQLREMLFPGSSAMQPKFAYDYQEMAVGVVNDVAGIAVTPFVAAHTPQTFPTMLRLEHAGKVVTYTGDTEWTDEILQASDGADLLIVECCFFDKAVRTHMNYQSLRPHLATLRAREVILTHMAPNMLGHQADVGERCAFDGMRLEL